MKYIKKNSCEDFYYFCTPSYFIWNSTRKAIKKRLKSEPSFFSTFTSHILTRVAPAAGGKAVKVKVTTKKKFFFTSLLLLQFRFLSEFCRIFIGIIMQEPAQPPSWFFWIFFEIFIVEGIRWFDSASLGCFHISISPKLRRRTIVTSRDYDRGFPACFVSKFIDRTIMP